MAQGQIKFGIGFNVDKSNLAQLKSSLADLQRMTITELVSKTGTQDAEQRLHKVREAATQVKNALDSSYNAKFNTYDLDKFEKQLLQTGQSVHSLKSAFQGAGAQGEVAIRNLATSLTSMQLPLQQTHKTLKEIGNTFMNTIRWSIASTAINTVTSSIQNAWSFTKQLDQSLNDIQIVTGKSADEMDSFARKANNAAKALGASTKAYTEASLIYYQQGLSDDVVAARTDTTIKAANVTGQSAQAVSEQLTAVWNGYKASAAESELYIDKLAAVAASTAADLEELSVGMSRVASAANIMGVDIDQLNAQLATIVSVTREAPESVGTALKTVFARMSDLEAGLDAETTLGEYTKQMAMFGIEALDANGNLRDMGDVIEEIGGKWETFSRNQQVALAQTIAGTRQYSRMMSLFDNWDMYESALKTSQSSAGTLAQQQEIYMESLEAHLQKVQTQAEELYMTLLDSDSFKSLLDLFTKLIDKVDLFVEGIGGGGHLLLSLIPILTRLFSGSIASGLTTTITNFQNTREEARMLKDSLEKLNSLKTLGLADYGSNIESLREHLIRLKQAGIVTIEQFNDLDATLRQYKDALNDTTLATEQLTKKPANIAANLQKSLGSGNINYEQGFATAARYGQTVAGKTKEEILSKLTDTAEGETNWYVDITAGFDAIERAIEEVIKKSKDLSTALKGLSEEDGLQNFTDAFNAAKTETAKLKGKDSVLSGSQKGSLTRQENAIAKQMASMQSLAPDSEEYAAEYQRLTAMVEKYQASVKKAGEVAKNAMEQTRKSLDDVATGAIPKLESKAKTLGESLKAAFSKLDLEQTIKQITNLTSNISMAVMAIHNLINIKDIWSRDDLTTWEKMSQLIMNVASSLSMMAPLALMAAKGIKSLQKAKVESAVASTAEAAAETAQAAAQRESNQATAEGIQLGQQEAAQDLKNAAANTAEAATETGGAAAKKGAAAAAGGLSKAGVWGIIIAAVIAAIAGYAYFIAKLYDAAANNVAKLQTKLDDCKKRQSELNDELNTFKELSSGYQENIKALNELTQGTKEWSEALSNANNNALELLQTYPELMEYVSYGVNGELIISDEGLDFIEQQKQMSVNQAARDTVVAQQNLRAGQIELQKTELLKSMDMFLTSYVAREEGVSLWKSVMVDQGAYNPQLEKALKGLSLDDLASSTKIEEALKAVGIEDKELAKELYNNRTQVKELILSINENNKLLQIEYKEKYRNYLDEKNFSGDNAAVATILAQQELAAGENKENLYIDPIASTKDKDQRRNYLAEYAKLKNLDVSKWKSVGGDKVKYKDSEGNVHKIEWRDIAEALGQKDFEDNLMQDSNVQIAQSKVTQFTQTAGEYTDASRDVLAAIIANDTEALGAKAAGNFTLGTIKGLEKALSDSSITAEQKEAIMKTKENLEEAFWQSGLSETLQASFKTMLESSQIELEKTSIAAVNNLKTLYNNFSLQNGEMGINALEEMLKVLGDNANAFIESIDLTSSTLTQDILTFLSDNNTGLSMSSDVVANFIAEIQLFKESVDEARERVKNINDTLNALGKKGDVIDEEQYQLLISTYGDQLKQYFQNMGDGTRMLTVTATEFQNAVNALRTQQLAKNIQTAGAAINDFSQKAALAEQTLSTDLMTTSQSSYMIADKSAQDYYANMVRTSTTAASYDSDSKITINGKTYTVSQINNMNNRDKNELLWTGYLGTEFGSGYSWDDAKNWGGNKIKIGSGEHITTDEMLESIYRQQIINDIYDPNNPNFQAEVIQSVYNKDAINNTLDSLSRLGYDATTIANWKSQIASYTTLDASNAQVTALVGAINTARQQKLNEYAGSENVEDVQKFEQYVYEVLSQFTSEADARAYLEELGLTGIAAEKASNIVGSYDFEANRVKKMLEKYESQQETIEKLNAEYEYMNSLLDKQASLIKLVAGEDAYAELANYYSKSLSVAEDQIQNNANAMKHWEQQMNQAIIDGDEALYEAAKANWEEASNAYYESMSQKIELLKEQEINAINAVFKARETLSGGKTLDSISEEWELNKTKSDLWLDDVNRAYGISGVRNKFTKALNSTSDITAQKQIRNLMEEQLEALEAQDKLSEYDLKRAEAKLAILEKEIALRDAQNNKTKMQLMRGADGSYSYQYVADMSAVAEAEQELADAQNQLYNIDVDEYKSNLDNVLQYYQEFKSKWLEAAAIANDAEREQRQQMLKEQYFGDDGILTILTGSDNATVFANLAETMGGAVGQVFGAGGDLQTWIDELNFDTLVAELEGVPSAYDQFGMSDFETSLNRSYNIVKNIAETMAGATWGADGSLQLTGGEWDAEAISAAIVTGLKGVKLTQKEDGTWEWAQATQMATGGYTGVWDSSGKLAILHEKELVLNQQDTENILNAVSLIRSLDSALLATLANFGGVSAGGIATGAAADKTIKQKVEITANFPNVSTKDEIEAAFDELINLATQHAFDKKK